MNLHIRLATGHTIGLPEGVARRNATSLCLKGWLIWCRRPICRWTTPSNKHFNGSMMGWELPKMETCEFLWNTPSTIFTLSGVAFRLSTWNGGHKLLHTLAGWLLWCLSKSISCNLAICQPSFLHDKTRGTILAVIAIKFIQFAADWNQLVTPYPVQLWAMSVRTSL